MAAGHLIARRATPVRGEAHMLPVISQDIRATTVNQEVISNRDEVVGYFNRWFGPGQITCSEGTRLCGPSIPNIDL
jgi:hypothetical protein